MENISFGYFANEIGKSFQIFKSRLGPGYSNHIAMDKYKILIFIFNAVCYNIDFL